MYTISGLNNINKVNGEIYVTSDTFFNYRDALYKMNRPFESVEAMNEDIIRKWNQRVGSNDIVIHVGNVAIGNIREIQSILSELNGKIVLIAGNHDTKGSSLSCRERFIAVNYKLEMTIDDQMFTFNHYPQFWWNGIEDGAMMVHGHLCGNTPTMGDKRILDVGVDNFDFEPLHIDEIVDILEQKVPDESFNSLFSITI